MELKNELLKLGSKEKSLGFSKFFKTGKGEYSEGDVFLGISVPNLRKTALKYSDIGFSEIKELLDSEIHEHRLAGLMILYEKYRKSNDSKIVDFYLANISRVNNWDLVDLSADKILGSYLFDKDKKILYDFAKSSNLWIRRISIVSTFYFIKKNRFDDTLKIADILVNDKHDLIHKAVGWMLREVGKRDDKLLEKFLLSHKGMPRTMLRYAIEKFSLEKRKRFMKL